MSMTWFNEKMMNMTCPNEGRAKFIVYDSNIIYKI
jgi:hypothetical protein